MQEERLNHDKKRLFIIAAFCIFFILSESIHSAHAAARDDRASDGAHLEAQQFAISDAAETDSPLQQAKAVSLWADNISIQPEAILLAESNGSEIPELPKQTDDAMEQLAELESQSIETADTQKQPQEGHADAAVTDHKSQETEGLVSQGADTLQPSDLSEQAGNESAPPAPHVIPGVKKKERRILIDTAYPYQEKDREVTRVNAAVEAEGESPLQQDGDQALPVELDTAAEQPSLLSSIYNKFRFSGYLKNETAYRYREPRSITKIRNIAYLNAVYPFSSRFRFNFSGWAYYDLAYDLFDYDTIAARLERNQDQSLAFIVNLPKDKDSPVFETRELYLDMLLDGMDIRIGKQIVVWGVLEGVRITDEINPMDFRELILPELLDYRMPLWTAKLDLYRGDTTYQFLWIPDIKFHKPAPPGSEWELLQEVPGTRRPESFDFKNSEIGFKLSSRRWDTEFSLSYFYTWDDFPSVFRAVRMDQVQNPSFLPTFTRMSIYGATLTKQMWSTIVKFETAVVTDKYFGVESVDKDNDGFLDNWGEFKRNSIRWGLGLDFNLWSTDFSPSFTQTIILNYDDAIIQDHFDSAFNLFLRKEFPESSTIVQFLGIYLINLEELYLKPKVIVRVTDRLNVAAGIDLFRGRKSQFGVASSSTALGGITEQAQYAQFVGNFHDNDRVFVEFKYAF